MNRNNSNNTPRVSPKQPASSYYRQRLANSIGSNATRAPAQSARAAIPNDSTIKKKPLENSYQPPPKRASGSSNGLVPKGNAIIEHLVAYSGIERFYKQTTNKPLPKPAPTQPKAK